MKFIHVATNGACEAALLNHIHTHAEQAAQRPVCDHAYEARGDDDGDSREIDHCDSLPFSFPGRMSGVKAEELELELEEAPRLSPHPPVPYDCFSDPSHVLTCGQMLIQDMGEAVGEHDHLFVEEPAQYH